MVGCCYLQNVRRILLAGGWVHARESSNNLWSDEPSGGEVQHKLHREGSDEYTWSIREEELPTECVGSFTSWVRLYSEAISSRVRERGLFLWSGRRLTLKSPSRTTGWEG